MRFFLLLSLQAVGLAVQAQPTTQAPDTRSPWNVGLKLGLGASYRDDISGHRTQATGGLTAGYTGQVAGGVLTLQADALLERRGPRP